LKKRLLFLTVSYDSGGTEKVTYDIISHLNPKKYDITWMAMYGGGYYEALLPEYVHKKYFFPQFIRFVIRLVEYLPSRIVHRIFIKEKYDVEIACGDDLPSKVINGSPDRNAKKIAWIHMDVIERGYKGHGVKTAFGRKLFYKKFDKIVNVSKDCEKQFIKKFGNDLPTMTIYNPIDADVIRKKANETPDIILPEDAFNIVCVGRFTDQKGFDRLVDAYSQIKDIISRNVHITIIGDGFMRREIQNMIEQNALSEVFELVGYHDNPYSILNQADLFLLSSRDESFALVVAEAMVLCIPVMSTRCTGPVELLRDGTAGMLVENSTGGIRDGILRVLTDNRYYSQMKTVAENNKNNFDIFKTMGEIESLFDE